MASPSPSLAVPRRTLTYAGIFLRRARDADARGAADAHHQRERLVPPGVLRDLARDAGHDRRRGAGVRAPGWFGDADVPRRLAQSALGFALAIPLCVAFALAVPLSQVIDFMGFVSLLAIGQRARAAVRVRRGHADARADPCGAAAEHGLRRRPDRRGQRLRAGDPAARAARRAERGAGAGRARRARAPRLRTRGGRRAAARRCVATRAARVVLGEREPPIPPLRPAWVKGMREDVAYLYSSLEHVLARDASKSTVKGPPGFWAKGRQERRPPRLRADRAALHSRSTAPPARSWRGSARRPAAHDVPQLGHHLGGARARGRTARRR